MKITNRFFHIALFSLAIMLSVFFCGHQKLLAQSCDGAFQTTNREIKNAELGLNLETQVLNKINSATGRYYQATNKQRQYIVRDLINAYSLVSLQLAPNLPTDVRNSVQQSIVNLRSCISADRRSFGTITARVLDFTGTSPVSSARIKANGFTIGTTAANGTLTFPVRAGDVEVEASVVPYFQKTAVILVAPGETKNIDIVLDESKDSYEDSSLILDESNNGILDTNFTSFTLRFSDGLRTIPLTRLSKVTLIDPPDTPSQTEQAIYLDSLFTVSASGVITPTNLTTLRSNLTGRNGVLRLLVAGEDSTGAEHRSEVLFQMGRFQINVQFQAPPSNTSLSRSGILVKVKSTPGNIIFRLVTNASGAVTLPKMPAGVFEVSAETFQTGKFYYGQGLAQVSGNFLINVNLLNTVDRVNGVAPFTIIPQFTGLRLEDESIYEEERQMRLQKVWTFQPFNNPDQFFKFKNEASPAEVNVSATANAQGSPVTNVATLTVPQGTQTVTVRYNIQTAEYPTYVLAQSIYDDVWSLNVETQTGQRILDLSRRVNEQVSRQPTWQSNGSTGNILNVSNLTATSDVTLSVIASATNISDALLPTTVQACLNCQPASITIGEREPDDTVKRNSGRKKKDPIDSEFYSIPRSGGTNTTQRYFKLKVNKSQGSTFQSFRAQLVNEGGNVLATIFDENVGGPNVQIVDENTLRVKVTNGPNTSTINSVPPPTNRISYKFRVTVTNGGQSAMDEKDSAPKKPLWRMPDGFGRYSTREAGGDDWCALQTYNWLNIYRSQINFINDVAGEHAKDLDHITHETGEDIDVFHPYVFTAPPSGSGCGNHLQLRNAVFAALNSPTEKEKVRQWILTSRARIDSLSASTNVSELIYSEGSILTNPCPSQDTTTIQGIASGWARVLLTTGKVTVNGQLLDFTVQPNPVPVWTKPNKLSFNHVHDSHLHITLVRIP